MMDVEPTAVKKVRGKKRALLKKFLFKTPVPAKFDDPPPETLASSPKTKPCNYLLSSDDVESLVPPKLFALYAKRKTQDFESRLVSEDWDILKEVGVMQAMKRREKIREREGGKEGGSKGVGKRYAPKPTSAIAKDAPSTCTIQEVQEGSRVRAFYLNSTGRTYLGVCVTIDVTAQTGAVAFDDGDFWGLCPLTSMAVEGAEPTALPVNDVQLEDGSNSGEVLTDFDDDEIVVGLRVSARYKTLGNTRYPGVVRKVNKKKRTAHINYDDGDTWDECPFDWMFYDTSGGSSASGLKTCPRCLVICHRYEGCDSMVCLCGMSFSWTEQAIFSESLLDKIETRIEEEKIAKGGWGGKKSRAVKLSDEGEFVDCVEISEDGMKEKREYNPRKKGLFGSFLWS